MSETIEEELITVRTRADGRGLKYVAREFLHNKYGKDAIDMIDVQRVAGRDKGYPVVRATFTLDHERATQ